jgi:hypothetical protein
MLHFHWYCFLSLKHSNHEWLFFCLKKWFWNLGQTRLSTFSEKEVFHPCWKYHLFSIPMDSYCVNPLQVFTIWFLQILHLEDLQSETFKYHLFLQPNFILIYHFYQYHIFWNFYHWFADLLLSKALPFLSFCFFLAVYFDETKSFHFYFLILTLSL